jgi:thioredoxin-like negative regulator of GroEL
LAVEEARRDPVPANLVSAGWYLLQMERFAEAGQFYAQALEKDPQPGTRLGYARVLIQLNRLDDADAQLKAAEQQGADAAELADVRRHLSAARARPPATAK